MAGYGKLATRFAPSPTGYLHVGNAYSALLCQQWAEQHTARCMLRIEDIDSGRCRRDFTEAIVEDLDWLGLHFHGHVRYQSDHLQTYTQALKRLQALEVIYPCFCTRKRIQAEIAHMGIAPHDTDQAPPYPGLCRSLSPSQRIRRMQHELFAWRLDMAAAMHLIGPALSWRDGHGHHHPVHAHSDVVIGRKDIGISYHLAVVVDDDEQGISHVIRGEDLLASTPIHCLLQALLKLPSPVYSHHRLLLDRAGHRLAKRHHAPTLRELRARGVAPERLRQYLLYECGGIWQGEKCLGKAAASTHHSM